MHLGWGETQDPVGWRVADEARLEGRPPGRKPAGEGTPIRARRRGCSRRQQSSELDGELPWGSHPHLPQAEWGPGHTFRLVPVGWRPARSQGHSIQGEELEPALTCSPLALRGQAPLRELCLWILFPAGLGVGASVWVTAAEDQSSLRDAQERMEGQLAASWRSPPPPGGSESR